MELVISVVVGILIFEAYVWLPKISEALIERAVQRLRSEDQDRCREEWKAGLDALPNTVIKLVHALSYLGAANRINEDFFENKLTEINTLIEECGHKHSGLVASFCAAKEKLGRSRQVLNLSLSGLKAQDDGSAERRGGFLVAESCDGFRRVDRCFCHWNWSIGGVADCVRRQIARGSIM